MAVDEEGTLTTLKAYRAIIIEFADRHRGRLFSTAGDAFLIEFGSAVEAMRCAISIQEELAVRNAELDDDRQMLFRIGINVGDVMIDGDDLFGNGVNVAARLEALAEPGGICVSGSAFEQVKNQISIGFEDMGPQTVKNIPQPVSSFRIISEQASVRREDPAPPADAVAVTLESQIPQPATQTRRWRVPVIIAVLLLLVAGGGLAVWNSYFRGPPSLASFPSNISTRAMSSSDIEALMTGMKIQGTSSVTGGAYEISL